MRVWPSLVTACSQLLFPGCSRAQLERDSLVRTTPVITRLDPTSGPAGIAHPIQVIIEGHGFLPTANTVRFGPTELRNLNSIRGGTRIVFSVPKEFPNVGEVPPGPLPPGTYEVTVTTPQGTSTPFAFTLTPEPGTP
ncbi:MAG: hypothetical protein HY700_17700 [Gemmatimonadetes bacterium]|nr:hypothetical protein [Gemmatimonadota bacterium]